MSLCLFLGPRSCGGGDDADRLPRPLEENTTMLPHMDLLWLSQAYVFHFRLSLCTYVGPGKETLILSLCDGIMSFELPERRRFRSLPILWAGLKTDHDTDKQDLSAMCSSKTV